MTTKELFEKRKIKQDSDGEYPYIMMYGQIDEIIQEVEALVRKETIDKILEALLTEARKTDYADRTEYDVAHDFIKGITL